MFNAKKWILRLSLAATALLLLAVLALYLSMDGLVRYGVERGANHATQQTTSLQSAKVSIANGTVSLVNLDISNPPAYGPTKFLTMQNCTIAASISSLFTSTVQVDSITISGLQLSLQQNGLKSNLQDILAACQSTTPAAGGSAAPTAPGKTLNIHVITLSGTKVDVNALGQHFSLDLGPIELKEPTNPDGRPMKIADVVAKVLVNVAQQIAQNPQIPAALKNGLGDINKVVGNVTDLINDPNLRDKAKNIGQNIGGLFKQKINRDRHAHSRAFGLGR